MNGKDKDSGTLQTVFENDDEYGSSEELPTVDATPKGPYQRELDKLQQQLLANEQKIKQQEELLLQYATPISHQTDRNRPYSHSTGTPPPRHRLPGTDQTTERTRRDHENRPHCWP